MKKIYLSLIFLAILWNCSTPKKTEQTNAQDEWVILFDGTNTDHWRGVDMDHFPSGWYIENDELLNDGTGKGNLLSRDQYSNFILEWEWRLLDEGGNSGLKYFVKEIDDEDGKYVLGLEYQMLDDAGHAWMKEGKMKPNDYHTTGALYEFFTPSSDKQLMPLGEFNNSKIVVNGNHTEHWLNGLKIVEYERGGDEFLKMKAISKFKDRPDFGLHETGHLLLQDHQSKVGFKNIRIKIINKTNP